MNEEELSKLDSLSKAAKPALWFAALTDDDSCMSMVVISTTPDIEPSGDDRDAKHLVAATLIQSPRYVDVYDGRWDENADLIVALRNNLPELIVLAREGLAARNHP